MVKQKLHEQDNLAHNNVSPSDSRGNKVDHESPHLSHAFSALGGDSEHAIAPRDDLKLVLDKIDQMSTEQARIILADMLDKHEYDYNFPAATREKIQSLLEGPVDKAAEDGWSLKLRAEAALNKFFSPYPEVRAITTPEDDPSMTCETIRAHLLGYSWACIGQFVNTLFTSRFPGIYITSALGQIVLYPCGLAMAFALPDWGFTVRGKRISLNPGPWTYKEQMLSTIILNVSFNTAYAFNNLQTQEILYYDKWITPTYAILLLLSTQTIGIGLAGMMRRFAVYPIEAIWPTILPTVALNRTLLIREPRESVHGWTISRYKFFFIVFGSMFVYYWLPGFLFTALSIFAWMCWIAPNNFNVNLITGSVQGLGFNPMPSFDWNVLGLNTPLQTPFYATFQQFIGTVLGGLVIIWLYFTNTSNSGYLPINSSNLFTNTGDYYDIQRILVNGTTTLNETAYQEYSPTFYSAGSLMAYGSSFALYPLTVVFVLLDAWRPLLRSVKAMVRSCISTTKHTIKCLSQFVRAVLTGHFSEARQHLRNWSNNSDSIYDGFDDPLTNLMRAYPEVPDWWFLVILATAFIFFIVIVTTWTQLDTPVWTIFFVLGLNLVFLIPQCYLLATTGMFMGLNILTELIIGYALPGRPEALMLTKAFGLNISNQGDNYISDQKMGFYARLPPRAVYRGQVISILITCFVCYGVLNFVDHGIEGICTPDQPQQFTCAGSAIVFFSSSIVWGAIGPQRVFSQLYPTLKYCFLLGFLFGLVWWTVKRIGPRVRSCAKTSMPTAAFSLLDAGMFTPISWLKYVHPSLIINGGTFWAPMNLSYWVGTLYVSIIFMWYIRRYKVSWWEKYNYVLAAGLQGGVAFSAVIIFFAVQWSPKYLNWWGNLVNSNTMDSGGGEKPLILLTEMPAKGYFGPDNWY